MAPQVQLANSTTKRAVSCLEAQADALPPDHLSWHMRQCRKPMASSAATRARSGKSTCGGNYITYDFLPML